MEQATIWKQKPSAILWDMDGVLVDTALAHYISWADALRPYGIRLTRAQFDATYGMNNPSTLRVFMGGEVDAGLVRKISSVKENAFRLGIPGNIHLLPGVVDWLDRFSEAGIPQAVASSAPVENIDAVLDETGIRHYFSQVVPSSDHPGKPDPWVFNEAVRRLGSDPARTIVLEDSAHGVLAAHRAGCRCIAVSEMLKAEETKTADLWVHRLDQVKLDDIQMILSR